MGVPDYAGLKVRTLYYRADIRLRELSSWFRGTLPGRAIDWDLDRPHGRTGCLVQREGALRRSVEKGRKLMIRSTTKKLVAREVLMPISMLRMSRLPISPRHADG
jgi:hypothetical protein